MTGAQSGSFSAPPEPIRDYPEKVGRYRIIRRLGEGGMGSVYLAQDTILRREVALKLPLTGTENDPEVRERFLREARSAATLDHPYICRVYDADEVDGRLYLAMAYIEGKSLADLVRAEGMPVRQVVALVGKLAIALQEAHAHGVVHRDLKPRNVMIRTVGSKREPVIVDFGLARLEGPDDVRMTRTGQIMGTPAYMAPEQLRGKPDEIGPACDIYALGVILYELLTGRLPFVGSPPVVMAQILTQEPPPPSTHRPELEAALDAICLKAMAKEVAKRYASMIDLATALTGYLRATPSSPNSGRLDAPIARPIEGDSIPTGADTLVSRFLGRDDDQAQPPTPGIDQAPPQIALTPDNTPSRGSATNAVLSSLAPLMGRKPRKAIIIASAILGLVLVLVAGIIFVVPTNKNITNSLGMKLALIPAGEFLMGSDASDSDAEDDEKVNGKKHEVRITKPFYMGVTEVTVGQFRQFVAKTNYRTKAERDDKGANGWNAAKGNFEQDPKYNWLSPGFKQEDDHPVVNVSWSDAVAFCEWLSEQEGKTYRLPTEAEWEYACRAGQTTRFWFGDNPEGLATAGNVADASAREKLPDGSYGIKAKDGYVFTAPVGSFRPNPFGLFDMHGNVFEWCDECYDKHYYANSPRADPRNSSTFATRVLRGGGWNRYPRYCRSAYRYTYTPDYAISNLGFRVVRDR